MVRVTVDSREVVCEVQGSHRFWALRSRIAIPIEHLKSVRARPDTAKNWWHGWKISGADLPGVFAAGLFRTGGKWVFWDVRHPENTIEIELRGDELDQLILEVENPEETAAKIQAAIEARDDL